MPRVRAARVVAQYLSYLTGLAPDARHLRDAGFGLLRGLSTDALDAATREFFARRLAGKFRASARHVIDMHRRQGHLTVLLTAACTAIAHLAGVALGTDEVLATELEAS